MIYYQLVRRFQFGNDNEPQPIITSYQNLPHNPSGFQENEVEWDLFIWMKVPSAKADQEIKKEVDSVMIGLLDCGVYSV